MTALFWLRSFLDFDFVTASAKAPSSWTGSETLQKIWGAGEGRGHTLAMTLRPERSSFTWRTATGADSACTARRSASS